MSEIEFGNPIHVDYGKKYKEALERAKDYHKQLLDEDNPKLAGEIENIFPELAKSEDERIRKTLIENFKWFCDDFPETSKWGKDDDLLVKDILAWLEKQGDTIKIKKGKNYLCTKTHKYAGVEWIEGVKYYSPEDYSLVNQGCTCYCPKYSKEEHNNFFKEVEYDGCLEVDKVEPKFKVGDWIVSSVLGTAHIIGVNDSNEYQLEYIDGKQEFSSIDYVNYEYDEWTIKDAKPCDVLVSKHNQPFIYNGI